MDRNYIPNTHCKYDIEQYDMPIKSRALPMAKEKVYSVEEHSYKFIPFQSKIFLSNFSLYLTCQWHYEAI